MRSGERLACPGRQGWEAVASRTTEQVKLFEKRNEKYLWFGVIMRLGRETPGPRKERGS